LIARRLITSCWIIRHLIASHLNSRCLIFDVQPAAHEPSSSNMLKGVPAGRQALTPAVPTLRINRQRSRERAAAWLSGSWPGAAESAPWLAIGPMFLTGGVHAAWLLSREY
jgi:hypothetical protein